MLVITILRLLSRFRKTDKLEFLSKASGISSHIIKFHRAPVKVVGNESKLAEVKDVSLC